MSHAETFDILSEDFETPAHHMDLKEIIENGVFYYPDIAHTKDAKQYRDKLNDLIKDYNERRGMVIYNYIS